jgi:hypothetical protein
MKTRHFTTSVCTLLSLCACLLTVGPWLAHSFRIRTCTLKLHSDCFLLNSLDIASQWQMSTFEPQQAGQSLLIVLFRLDLDSSSLSTRHLREFSVHDTALCHSFCPLCSTGSRAVSAAGGVVHAVPSKVRSRFVRKHKQCGETVRYLAQFFMHMRVQCVICACFCC